MRVMRHSFGFIIFFSIFTILMILVAFISFDASISIEDCLALDMPVLAIETEGAKKIKSREKYLKANYALIKADGRAESGKCKIRGRGNTTWETRELYKKPYLLKLDEEKPLLGFPAARKWVLMANTADKTSLRNFYAEHLATKIFGNFPWTPKSRYFSLFVNGQYEGLYALTEKIEAVAGRLPIREEEGSFLFEVNSRQDKDFNFKSENGVFFSLRTNLDFVSDEEFLRRQDFIQNAENILFDTILEKNSFSQINWRSLFDLNSFIDWYLINELTKNHDAQFKSSCYLYYDSAAKKIFMGPIWDFDISCGNIRWNGCENPEGFWVKDALWLKKLFENEEFVTLVKNRWLEKRAELQKSIEWIESTSKKLKPSVMMNDAVWKNIGHRQWPHAPGWENRKTYESEVEYMTDWLEKRILWLDKAISEL